MAFKNRDRLRRRLKAIPREIRIALRAQLKANAEELVTAQKRFVPKDDHDLENSITSQDVSDSTRIAYQVRAGGAATTKPVRKGQSATYDYALAQELGTEDMAANPFFYPPYRAKRKAFKARLTRAVKAGIAKGASAS